MGRERGSSLRVAITGPTSEFGALLLPRLLAEPRLEQLVTFGPRPVTGARLIHHRVDLTRWDVESELESALSETPVDVLYHLAFLHGRTRGAAFAHELEVIGTLHTLAAAVRAGVRHVVVPSTTTVYGARPGNPVLLSESAPLHGCPGSRFVTDRVEVERQLETFRRDHPGVGLTVLRFAPVLGPTVDNPGTRYFRRPVVPMLLGFDPLWQAVHEEDAREVLLRVLDARRRQEPREQQRSELAGRARDRHLQRIAALSPHASARGCTGTPRGLLLERGARDHEASPGRSPVFRDAGVAWRLSVGVARAHRCPASPSSPMRSSTRSPPARSSSAPPRW